jgi:single-strand DNA-binding protein
VIVQGRLERRSFEIREGEKRTVVELEVDEIGPSLRYATADVTKQPRSADGSTNTGPSRRHERVASRSGQRLRRGRAPF